MIFIRSKQPRLRLPASEYGELRQQVLRRDGWRCQLCGEKCNLEVHHKQLRSHSGDDSERKPNHTVHRVSSAGTSGMKPCCNAVCPKIGF
jgi:hypothetical protein